MASIISRNNRYCVVYSYVDEQGNRKQKWQTFKTLPEAKARKTEIEYNQQLGAFTIPNCTTVSELLTEYVSLYGKAKWSISAYTSNMSLIRHYIEPLLGSVKLKEITARTLEKYYQTLLKTPAVPKMTDRKNKKSSSLVTPTTIHKVHNLLRSAFNQAEKWDLIEKNDKTIYKFTNQVREVLSYMSYAELVFISAKTGQRLPKIFDVLDMVIENHALRVQTGVLNEILTEAVAMKQPPSDKGKRLKLYYITQVSVKPPTFVVFINDRQLMHFSYTRYLENQIRNTFGFRGTPIHIIARERKER